MGMTARRGSGRARSCVWRRPACRRRRCARDRPSRSGATAAGARRRRAGALSPIRSAPPVRVMRGAAPHRRCRPCPQPPRGYAGIVSFGTGEPAVARSVRGGGAGGRRAVSRRIRGATADRDGQLRRSALRGGDGRARRAVRADLPDRTCSARPMAANSTASPSPSTASNRGTAPICACGGRNRTGRRDRCRSAPRRRSMSAAATASICSRTGCSAAPIWPRCSAATATGRTRWPHTIGVRATWICGSPAGAAERMLPLDVARYVARVLRDALIAGAAVVIAVRLSWNTASQTVGRCRGRSIRPGGGGARRCRR